MSDSSTKDFSFSDCYGGDVGRGGVQCMKHQHGKFAGFTVGLAKRTE